MNMKLYIVKLRYSLPIRSTSDFVTYIHNKTPVLTGVIFICGFFYKEKQDWLSVIPY